MKTAVTFTSYTNYDGLPDYPNSGYHTTSFDATDCTISVYVQQFRAFLKAEGFSEQLIDKAIGEG